MHRTTHAVIPGGGGRSYVCPLSPELPRQSGFHEAQPSGDLLRLVPRHAGPAVAAVDDVAPTLPPLRPAATLSLLGQWTFFRRVVSPFKPISSERVIPSQRVPRDLTDCLWVTGERLQEARRRASLYDSASHDLTFFSAKELSKEFCTSLSSSSKPKRKAWQVRR